MQDHPGAQVAGARTHHEASVRNEAVGCVHAATLVHRRHAGGSAQVGENHAAVGGRVARLVGQLLHEELVGQPVGPVAQDTLVRQLPRDRHDPRQARHAPVKGGVEARDLGGSREHLPEDMHDLELRHEVLRIELAQAAELLLDLRSEQHRVGEAGSPVDQPVADAVDAEAAGVVGEPVEEAVRRRHVVRDAERVVEKDPAGLVLHQAAPLRLPDALAPRRQQSTLVLAEAVHGKLNAGRSAVDREELDGCQTHVG